MNFEDGRRSAGEAVDSSECKPETPSPHKYRGEFKRIAKGRLPTELRESILDAVGRTLRVSSYESFSMEEVAAHASISRRTLYNQFGGRDDLYRSFFERVIKEVGGKVTDEIPDRMSPPDGMMFFVECCMEVYGSREARDLLMSVIRDGESQPWLVHAYHREVHDRLVRSCENYILKQSRRTPLAPGVSRYVGEQLVGIVKALTFGAYIFGQVDQKMAPTKERLSVLANAYSALLMKETSKSIG